MKLKRYLEKLSIMMFHVTQTINNVAVMFWKKEFIFCDKYCENFSQK